MVGSSVLSLGEGVSRELQGAGGQVGPGYCLQVKKIVSSHKIVIRPKLFNRQKIVSSRKIVSSQQIFITQKIVSSKNAFSSQKNC